MILVVTNKRDVTTDFVIRELRVRNASFVRFNTEDFLERWSWRWTLDGWSAKSLRDTFDSSSVNSVYYRRPQQPNPRSGTARDAASYAMREGLAALNELLASLDVPWISARAALDQAENKLFQLRFAREAGFTVPETIVTSDVSDARALLSDGPIIVKPLFSGWLSDDPPRLAYTTRFDSSASLESTAFAVCPHLVQRATKSAQSCV